MSHDEAKKLYFDYLGSVFHMDRDGVRDRYLSAKISPSTEATWLEELTRLRLENLHSCGDWWSIYFLDHHNKCEHLETVLGAVPRGKLWQKCAYLETLLSYAQSCAERVEIATVRAAIDRVIELSQILLRQARSASSRDRIEKLLQRSSLARQALQSTPSKVD